VPNETVRSALALAVQRLSEAGVESSRLTAELLLGDILGWSRVRTLTCPEAPVDEISCGRFFALVQRRMAGEPLQYIRGEQEFYGLRFRVTPAVLIPRPETELLVEAALNLATSMATGLRFADIGTGCGCIAVSFAAHAPASIGWAVDTSPAALAIAAENAARGGVRDRLCFICGDLLECLGTSPGFDFVFSNPPYIAEHEFSGLAPQVRDHEPSLALLGGASGLAYFPRLISQASCRMRPGGCLLLEIGAGQSGAVGEFLLAEGLKIEKILDDLQGIPRCIIARKDLGSVHG
jgi:release factor glutamine methyltransferase